MEGTGHYRRNLFAYLVSEGFTVALLNPIRTRRFRRGRTGRTKTDAVDALNIARFAGQKDPPVRQLTEEELDELREVMRLRETASARLWRPRAPTSSRTRPRFREFTHYVRSLNSELATTLLAHYSTTEQRWAKSQSKGWPGQPALRRPSSRRRDLGSGATRRGQVGRALSERVLSAADTLRLRRHHQAAAATT